MYSWGGGGCRPKISECGKKIPNILWLRSHEGVCYPDLQTKIRRFYVQTYYRSMQCCRMLFLFRGMRRRAEGTRKFLNLEFLKCHFLEFGEVLTEFRWSENSVLVCRNLQFAYNLVVLNGRRRLFS
jgi:hypothetical protein